MTSLGEVLRTRLLPAALTAAGVALVTAGLITYTDPSAAGIPPSPSPAATTAVVPPESPRPSGSGAAPSPSAPGSSPSASAPAVERVATRIAVPALRIDLPVIAGTPEYPPCNVALYIEDLHQPGGDGAIYVYAHARAGMFLPLLQQSQIRDGAGMKGMIVQVWTSDEQLFLYEITEVRRHATDLDDATTADHEQLWLQTSEGPRGTIPKLQVVAEPLSVGPAPDPADAHPTPKPVACS